MPDVVVRYVLDALLNEVFAPSAYFRAQILIDLDSLVSVTMMVGVTVCGADMIVQFGSIGAPPPDRLLN